MIGQKNMISRLDGFHKLGMINRRIFKVFTLIISAICLVLIFFNNNAASNDDRVSEDNIERLVNSSAWEDRDLAASAILSIPELDSLKTTILIINGIRRELAGPQNLSFPTGSYFSYSDHIINQYLFDLEKLGSSASPILRDSLHFLSGNFKDCLDIALGLLKDESVHTKLPLIIDSSSMFSLRAMAVLALSRYQDKKDSIYFKKALEDTCKVIVHNDTGFPSFHEVYYPVRGQAINALKVLGFNVTPDSIGGYIVQEKK